MELFQKTYQQILIGHRMKMLYNGSIHKGAIIDKYLTEDNVLVDIRFDNGIILERKNFFVDNQPVIILSQ